MASNKITTKMKPRRDKQLGGSLFPQPDSDEEVWFEKNFLWRKPVCISSTTHTHTRSPDETKNYYETIWSLSEAKWIGYFSWQRVRGPFVPFEVFILPFHELHKQFGSEVGKRFYFLNIVPDFCPETWHVLLSLVFQPIVPKWFMTNCW